MKLKNGKVFVSKFFGTGPSSCEKRIYRPAVSQSLRNMSLGDNVEECCRARMATDVNIT